ncbi:MAG: ABC transporter ATP-binding protein [Lentisphaeraceae bacterium]|nr:ABC transporter ATP-binding protein [Lentisphaeraceae bacterium]
MHKDFLKVEGLTKNFGRFTALNDVSFSVKQGEAFALLGESGCGKTTLLRCIAGLETPDCGSIEVEGAKFYENKSLIPVNQRNIGLVFQDYAVFPHKSVDENISFGVKDKNQKSAKLQQMLKLFHLEDQQGKMPDQLSGGQLQRVAIARTLAASPSMILMDEPFSNLDKKLGIQLRNELKEIFKDQNLASILVTHDQQEAMAYADKVAVMKSGIILQCGSPEEIYLYPDSIEVAEFLGDCQFINGTAKGQSVETSLGELALSREAKGEVKVLVRPETIQAELDENGKFEIKLITFLGSSKELTVSDGNIELSVRVPSYQSFEISSKVDLKVNSSVVAFN